MFNRPQYRRFLWRYCKRNPAGTFAYLWEVEWNHVYLPWIRDTAEKIGLKPILKKIYRSVVGSPVRS